MPLPWLLVFLMIFLCVSSVSMFLGSFTFNHSSIPSKVCPTFGVLPW